MNKTKKLYIEKYQHIRIVKIGHKQKNYSNLLKNIGIMINKL